jgi:hypothetical protein
MQGREEGRDPVSAKRASVKREAETKEVSFVCLDAHREVELVKNLYTSLLEAKRRCGEPTEDLSFPKFHRLIASKADGIKEQKGCDRVQFSVAIENGHVSFKARADHG